jgi:phytanoyl-CoA hydroxylase
MSDPITLHSEADARHQQVITDEQAQFFRDNGYCVIRNVIQGEELRLLQEQTMRLVESGISRGGDEDYLYRHKQNGELVFWRVEYVLAKLEVIRALMGHPFILRSVEKLQGRNFVPTWDSMVVKVPDQGAVVPWHRDAAHPVGCEDPRPIFNVDFYLDQADLKSCLWVIPGSNRWEAEKAKERCSRPGFDREDAVPVPMNPGDVILHNIELLHGSPEGDGNSLRRTIYFEYRPGEIEAQFGPHTLEYLTLKQHLLLDCIETRKRAAYTEGEKPYEYRPTGAFSISEVKKPASYRYAHEYFWRNNEVD